jgi:hypothetical protein
MDNLFLINNWIYKKNSARILNWCFRSQQYSLLTVCEELVIYSILHWSKDIMYTYLRTNKIPDMEDRSHNTDEKDLSYNRDKEG